MAARQKYARSLLADEGWFVIVKFGGHFVQKGLGYWRAIQCQGNECDYLVHAAAFHLHLAGAFDITFVFQISTVHLTIVLSTRGQAISS